MGSLVHQAHSIIALVLIIAIAVSIGFSVYTLTRRTCSYSTREFKIAKVAFILSHIMLLLGVSFWVTLGGHKLMGDMSSVMKVASLRQTFVEHPFINIIAVIVLSVGYIKVKNSKAAEHRARTNAIFYAIALVLLLSRIPYDKWLS